MTAQLAVFHSTEFGICWQFTTLLRLSWAIHALERFILGSIPSYGESPLLKGWFQCFEGDTAPPGHLPRSIRWIR